LAWTPRDADGGFISGGLVSITDNVFVMHRTPETHHPEIFAESTAKSDDPPLRRAGLQRMIRAPVEQVMVE